jgi:hypothetical protein
MIKLFSITIFFFLIDFLVKDRTPIEPFEHSFEKLIVNFLFSFIIFTTMKTKNKELTEMASKIKTRLDLKNDFIDNYLICKTLFCTMK